MSSRVTEAATRYVSICAAERDLRKRRGACECEHQCPVDTLSSFGGDEPKRHPDGGAWAGAECWKKVDVGDHEHPHREPYAEGSDRGWCDSCTERQRLHEELADVTRKRVGAWATLRAAVASEVRDE